MQSIKFIITRYVIVHYFINVLGNFKQQQIDISQLQLNYGILQHDTCSLWNKYFTASTSSRFVSWRRAMLGQLLVDSDNCYTFTQGIFVASWERSLRRSTCSYPIPLVMLSYTMDECIIHEGRSIQLHWLFTNIW